ncbi:MAG TPA: ABC transporter ATP-binding protein [Armatimonadota bacterium]|nr:ABC transporter ATP-binding protein [Armatimonadota bacterium]
MTGKQKDMKSAEKRLLGYFAPYWRLFALGLVCTLVVKGIDLLFAFLIGNVVGAAINKNHSLLNIVALAIVGIHILKWIFTYGQTYVVSAATQKIAVQLRNQLYTHLQSLSLSFFERTRIGHLMSRMTNDVGLIQSSGNHIIESVSAPVGIIGSVIAIFVINWKLAVISVVAMPLMSYTVIKISTGMRGLTELLQIRLADVAAVVQETLSAVRIVKSFAMEDYETSRFAGENQRTYGAAMRAIRRSAALSPTLELIGVTGIAFVLWYGGNMVARNAVPGFDAGRMVTFLLMLKGISDSSRIIGRLNITYHSTMAGAQRILDVLDEVPEIQDAPDARPLAPIRGRVEFQDISFAYSRNHPVLENISFVVEPGQQIALVGPSGAGKSTIANLIPRFYEATSGGILIDGTDIRTVTANSLRQQIAIVPQETILFSSSVGENIAYGRIEANQDEIIEAAKAANANDFIERLPEGYDTLVGERGVKLSGGERQRVAIARALLKNPKLLILDEATSSLDVASEAVVQEALERLMKGRTTLIIAHRLSTIVNADRILVIKEGRIVESGSHQELLDRGGLYSELYAIQSKGNGR